MLLTCFINVNILLVACAVKKKKSGLRTFLQHSRELA